MQNLPSLTGYASTLYAIVLAVLAVYSAVTTYRLARRKAPAEIHVSESQAGKNEADTGKAKADSAAVLTDRAMGMLDRVEKKLQMAEERLDKQSQTIIGLGSALELSNRRAQEFEVKIANLGRLHSECLEREGIQDARMQIMEKQLEDMKRGKL